MDEPEQAWRWYLLQCKVQQQQRALENLANQEYHCFNPTHPVQRRRRRKLETRDEPLFPGYLFIQLGTQTNWRSLLSTRGVLKVVSFNGTMIPVSDEVIEGLWQRCHSEAAAEPEPLFRPGQRVVVTEGCFRHIEAIVQATQGEERVVLLMNLMHSPQQIEIPAAQVALA
ncbi:MAG: transcription/translation regulatory transformer protein RfaH [Pseudohongiellaceae bacterium]